WGSARPWNPPIWRAWSAIPSGLATRIPLQPHRQRVDDLLAVLRPSLPQDLAPNAVPQYRSVRPALSAWATCSRAERTDSSPFRPPGLPGREALMEDSDRSHP